LGRKEKEIPEKELREMRRRMENGLITSQQAADALGIGRATLFRKFKKLE
jgi:transcriptional regulator of acetoin/glycerol metabolism